MNPTNPTMSDLLKDPRFTDALITQYGGKLPKKKTSLLSRIFSALSFDEWSDDYAKEMRSWTDDKGKVNRLRVATAPIRFPINYIVDAAKQIGGAVSGDANLIDEGQPHGREMLRELAAFETMALKKNKGKKLTSDNWEDVKKSYGVTKSKVGSKLADIGTSVGGFAADVITPTLFVGAAKSATKALSSAGKKTIQEGVKAAGKASLTDLASSSYKKAASLAKEAVMKTTGGEVPKGAVKKVLESSNYLDNLAEQYTKKGFYTGGAGVLKNPSLVAEGPIAETVGRYLENPIFAGVEDLIKGGKAGVKAVGGQKLVDDMSKVAKSLTKPFEHLGIAKESSQKLADIEYGLEKKISSANYLQEKATKQAENIIKELSKEGGESFLKPENIPGFKEFLTGSTQNMQFGQMIKALDESGALGDLSKSDLKILYDALNKGRLDEVSQKVIEKVLLKTEVPIQSAVKEVSPEIVAKRNSLLEFAKRKKLDGLANSPTADEIDRLLGMDTASRGALPEDTMGLWKNPMLEGNQELQDFFDPMLSERANLEQSQSLFEDLLARGGGDYGDDPDYQRLVRQIMGDDYVSDIQVQTGDKFASRLKNLAKTGQVAEAKDLGILDELIQKELLPIEKKGERRILEAAAKQAKQGQSTIEQTLYAMQKGAEDTVKMDLRSELLNRAIKAGKEKAGDYVRKTLDENGIETFITTSKFDELVEKEFKKPGIQARIAEEFQKAVDNSGIMEGKPAGELIGQVDEAPTALDEAIDKVMTSDNTPMITTGISKEINDVAELLGSTAVVDVNEDALRTFLTSKGLTPELADKIVVATKAYKNEALNQGKMMEDFVGFLKTARAPKEDIAAIQEAMGRMSEYVGSQWTKELSKQFADDVSLIERNLQKLGEFDSRAKQVAEGMKTLVFNPMRRQLERAAASVDIPEITNVGPQYTEGIYDVTSEQLAKESGSILRGSQKTFKNSAIVQAYNAVSDKPLKLANTVDKWAKMLVGTGVGQTDKVIAFQEFYSNMLKGVKEGELGDKVRIITDEADVPKGFKKLGNVQILDDANVYFAQDMYQEVRGLNRFYLKSEQNYFMKLATDFNNIWKMMQTGAGFDLPKVPNGEKMGKIVQYYNENMAFSPISMAFTVRNYVMNAMALMLSGDMGAKDIVEYNAKAVDVIKALAKDTGEELDLGLIPAVRGLSKETDPVLVQKWLADLEKSGLLQSSYAKGELAQELIGKTAGTAAEPLGKVAGYFSGGRSVKFNERIEMLWKTTLFLKERARGASIDDAANTVNKVLFDYSASSPLERDVIKPFTVFYTWTKKNVELMYDAAKNDPKRFKIYGNGLDAIGDNFGSDLTPEERAALPEWLDNFVSFAMKDDSGNISTVSGLGTNLESAADFMGNNPKDFITGLMGMVAPVLRVPMEQIMDYSAFKQKPLSEDTSAYSYRALPGPMKDLLGIKELGYTMKDGTERKTYTMDGKTKHLLENLLGRGFGNIAQSAALASGQEPVGPSMLDKLSGIRYNSYDTNYLLYQKQKADYEQAMKTLEKMGIVSGFSNYSLNKNAETNYPGISNMFNRPK